MTAGKVGGDQRETAVAGCSSLQVAGWVQGLRRNASGSFHAINASYPGLELVRPCGGLEAEAA